MRGSKVFLIILFFDGILFRPVFVSAVNSSKNIDINLLVSSCNNNGVCESGENNTVCSADCPIVTTTPPVTTPVVIPSGGGTGIPVTQKPAVVIVLNVDNLSAEAGDRQVVLRWIRPVELVDYQGIMIRRSTVFYPSDIGVGGLLYQGAGLEIGKNTFEYADFGLKNGVRYFYTVFVYNTNGDFSSGASVSALPQSPEMEKVKKLEVKPIEKPPELSVPKIVLPSKGWLVKFSDFIFEQNGGNFVSKDNKKVDVLSNLPINIYLDNKKIPKDTKTIIMTLDNQEQIRTFFLKNDENLLAHVVGLPAFCVEGSNKAIFSFLNSNNLMIGSVEGEIDSKAVLVAPPVQELIPQTPKLPILSSAIGVVKKTVAQKYFWPWVLWIIIILLLILRLLVKRRRKK